MPPLRILLVTQTCFFPQMQGDSAREYELIKFFKARGHQVFVCHFHDYEQLDADYSKMRSFCDELSVYYPTETDLANRSSMHPDDWCPPAFRQQVREMCQQTQPDALIVQFVFHSACFEGITGKKVLKVLDADNVFTGRGDQFTNLGLPYHWFTTTIELETMGLRRADLVLAIQESEEQTYRNLHLGKPVLLVPHVFKAPPYEPCQGNKLLYVGSDNVENALGIKTFIREALPQIVARHDTSLLVAGKICQSLGSQPEYVTLLGKQDKLAHVYRQAAIVINTAPLGTGLKVKTVEALCYGRCHVSTPFGVQGLERYGEAYYLAENMQEFVEKIDYLLRHEDEIEAAGRRAYDFASHYFDPAQNLMKLEVAIQLHRENKLAVDVPVS